MPAAIELTLTSEDVQRIARETVAMLLPMLQEYADKIQRPVAKDEYLSKKEVADLLHISTKSVEQWSKNGDLPAPVHVGTLVRWKRSDVVSLGGNA